MSICISFQCFLNCNEYKKNSKKFQAKMEIKFLIIFVFVKAQKLLYMYPQWNSNWQIFCFWTKETNSKNVWIVCERPALWIKQHFSVSHIALGPRTSFYISLLIIVSICEFSTARVSQLLTVILKPSVIVLQRLLVCQFKSKNATKFL